MNTNKLEDDELEPERIYGGHVDEKTFRSWYVIALKRAVKMGFPGWRFRGLLEKHLCRYSIRGVTFTYEDKKLVIKWLVEDFMTMKELWRLCSVHKMRKIAIESWGAYFYESWSFIKG